MLDRPTLGTSNRFMRRFGSRRFIRVRIQKDALMQKGNSLAEYFYRPFIISGAVFRAFFAKEQNVFLFRTNEVVRVRDGEVHIVPVSEAVVPGEMSLFDLIEWHNDLKYNNDQVQMPVGVCCPCYAMLIVCSDYGQVGGTFRAGPFKLSSWPTLGLTDH